METHFKMRWNRDESGWGEFYIITAKLGRPILGPISGLLYGPILDLQIFGPILGLLYGPFLNLQIFGPILDLLYGPILGLQIFGPILDLLSGPIFGPILSLILDNFNVIEIIFLGVPKWTFLDNSKIHFLRYG